MNKKIILSAFTLFSVFTGIAQQIPVGSCGLVYIHDAAGNRTKRVYFCNNGLDPYPTLMPIDSSAQTNNLFTKEEQKNMEIQEVDALYPNPTTGIFYITFSKTLSQANISIVDINGKPVQQFTATGIKLVINLSALPAGVYFVRIEENGKLISKKVIKQ